VTDPTGPSGPTERPDVPAADPALLAELRADLDGWTVDAVAEIVGPVAHAALGREQVVPVLRATAGRAEPAAVLLRLFVLGQEITRAALDRALPRTGTAGARRLGLADAAGEAPDDAVRARVDLRPYAAVDAAGTADWWVVSDLGELATGRALRADHVLGVGGASTMLARCTPRRRVGRVLDLGTGCGVQALHAARHAACVVATDLSRRALAMADVTWRLNGGGDDLDLRAGSLLDPVDGERFDLVVSNPPFVITPRTDAVPAYEYRDGGLEGDEIVRRLVTGVGGVLAPGGTAVMLGNWEHRAGEPWTQRVGGWLDDADADLDVWVVQREVQDPAEYAELWIRDGGTTSGPEYDALYAAWLDDFARRGVEGVGFGLVVVRRPDDAAAPLGAGTPGTSGTREALRRVEDLYGPLDAPLGEHLAAVLDAHDRLAVTTDEALAAARLRVAPDVSEERHHRPGEEHPSVVLLRQGGGFGRSVRAGTALAGLVGACDGDLPVGVVVAALADLLDVPAADLAAEVLPDVRGLVLDGFLVPAD
jgi:methylase of polypeptide subunit release factors